MPQKKNPDIAELARGKTRPPHRPPHRPAHHAQGPARSPTTATSRRTRSRCSTRSTRSLLALGRPRAACSPPPRSAPTPWPRPPTRPYAAATDLAELLVERGTPFRDAHAIVGEIVRTAARRGRRHGRPGRRPPAARAPRPRPCSRPASRSPGAPPVAAPARPRSPTSSSPLRRPARRRPRPPGRCLTGRLPAPAGGGAPWPHREQIKVRYQEVDLQNVVFNAHYLGWCDIACAAWMQATHRLDRRGRRDRLDAGEGRDGVAGLGHLRRHGRPSTAASPAGAPPRSTSPSGARSATGRCSPPPSPTSCVVPGTKASTPVPDSMRGALGLGARLITGRPRSRGAGSSFPRLGRHAAAPQPRPALRLGPRRRAGRPASGSEPTAARRPSSGSAPTRRRRRWWRTIPSGRTLAEVIAADPARWLGRRAGRRRRHGAAVPPQGAGHRAAAVAAGPPVGRAGRRPASPARRPPASPSTRPSAPTGTPAPSPSRSWRSPTPGRCAASASRPRRPSLLAGLGVAALDAAGRAWPPRRRRPAHHALVAGCSTSTGARRARWPTPWPTRSPTPTPDGSRPSDPRAWVRRARRGVPGRSHAAVAPLLLHVVRLAPGEAVHLPAGNLHAYLSGAGVELMAASDNVLRGGLTPKHVDVDELLAVLRFEPGVPPAPVAKDLGGGVTTYDSGEAAFALAVVDPGAARCALEPTGTVAAARHRRRGRRGRARRRPPSIGRRRRVRGPGGGPATRSGRRPPVVGHHRRRPARR